jgi:hypothetical protein
VATRDSYADHFHPKMHVLDVVLQLPRCSLRSILPSNSVVGLATSRCRSHFVLITCGWNHPGPCSLLVLCVVRVNELIIVPIKVRSQNIRLVELRAMVQHA